MIKNDKFDRQKQRTRQLLKDALLSLVVEKGYASITVQNIIDRANLGRSTFYAHYLDKEDLLISGMEEVVHSLISNDEDDPLIKEKQGENQHILSTLPIFCHAQEQYRLHKAIVGGRGIDVVIKTIQSHLASHIQDQITQLIPKGQTLTVPPNVIAHYLAGTLLNLLIWWLDNEMPYPPERMDAMFQELTMPGVLSALGITF